MLYVCPAKMSDVMGIIEVEAEFKYERNDAGERWNAQGPCGAPMGGATNGVDGDAATGILASSFASENQANINVNADDCETAVCPAKAQFGLSAHIKVPSSIEEALTGPQSTEWRAAIMTEYEQLLRLGCRGEYISYSKVVYYHTYDKAPQILKSKRHTTQGMRRQTSLERMLVQCETHRYLAS